MAFNFSTPSFSFGASTPAFGTAAAPAFGAAAPSAFGAAGTTFGSAGAGLPKTASTPAFGAVPSSGPGLFGASSTPSFAFSFSQAPASQPPASQSLFGAAAPAATPAMFGVTPGATPGLFGTTAVQPQMSPLGLGPGAAQGPDLSAVRELESIKDAFVPGGTPGGAANPRYRFQYLLLNVVENPAARVKPPGVDELQWREALQRAGGPDNPDHLWPVPATGFRDLLSRRAAQEEALRENASRLEALVGLASALSTRQEAVLRETVEALRRRHVALTQRLLRVMRHVDALEGRFAFAMGYRGATPAALASQLQRQLDELESALASRAGGGLRGQVESLAEVGGLVDDAALRSLQDVMQQYTEAIGKLQEVARRNERDASILDTQAGGANGSGMDMA